MQDCDQQFNPRYVVTGASCAVGMALKKMYESHPEKFRCTLIFDLYPWRLGRPLPQEFQDCLLIHLAHDRKMTFSESVKSIKMLSPNIRYGSIYLSTVSAHRQAKSNYGKKKYFEERYFLKSNATVIKSGLIFSEIPSSTQSKILDFIKRFVIIPLPFNGKSEIFVTDINSLTLLIQELLINPKAGEMVHAFHLQPLSMREVFEKFQSKYDLKRFYLPIPNGLSKLLINFFLIIFPKNSSLDSLNSLFHQISRDQINKMKGSNIEFPPL